MKKLLLAAVVFGAIGTAIYLKPTDIPIKGAINPNVTQENLQQTVCVANYTATIRPSTSYTNALKAKLLGSNKDMGAYELDHAIALVLGGNPTSPDNLWPQSYNPQPGAREKDYVENYLHRQLCSNQITLKDAQEQIFHWKSIYEREKGKLGGLEGSVEYDGDDQ